MNVGALRRASDELRQHPEAIDELLAAGRFDREEEEALRAFARRVEKGGEKMQEDDATPLAWV